MQKWITIEKDVGQTPLQAVESYKAWVPGMQHVKMAYAGRLDPMASGKLLVLIGDECKNQKTYHALDKTYQVEILLDVSSDSGDVLGLISATSPTPIDQQALTSIVRKQRGPFHAPYPHFSSKTVDGRPLHTWTLMGKINEITVPKQNGYIYAINITDVRTQTGQDIYTAALEKIHALPEVTDERKALGADFRRASVLDTWEKFRTQHQNTSFTIVTITCTCSAGTYMRSLAEEIGNALKTKALAFSIHRTHIGKLLRLPFGQSLWLKKY